MASRTRLLIDGDLIVFKATAASEQNIDWGGEVSSVHSKLSDAAMTIEQGLFKIIDKLDLQNPEITFAFSSSENFRKDLYPDYKGHRTSRKPVGFALARDWVRSSYDCVVVPRMEADDVLGIIATAKGDHVIVSDDKDLLQIPGLVYVPRTGDLHSISSLDGFRHHMIQTLSGDRADNYPGCPGVGPVTAEKLLADLTEGDMWQVVLEQFERKGLTEEDALLQARLAKILTIKEFDRKTKRIKSWHPPPSARTATTKQPAPASASKKRSTAQRTTPDRLPSKKRKKSASTATSL